MEVELLKGFEALAAQHLERFNHVSRNLAEQLLTVEEGLPLAAQKQGKVLPWLLRLEALDRQVFVVLSKLFPDVQEVLVLNLGQQEAKRSALSGRRVGPVLHHFNYFLLAAYGCSCTMDYKAAIMFNEQSLDLLTKRIKLK